MRISLHLIACAGMALACDSIAHGADDPKRLRPPVEIETGGLRESLTNNQPDWSSVYLEAAHSFRSRNTIYGGIRHTRRFRLDDEELYGGLYYPLAESWTGLLEATVSSSHNVLPQHSVLGQLQKTLAPGLVASAGLKHAEYSESGVRTFITGAEYYWSAFRAAYTYYSGRLEGAGSAPAHRFQFSYYYGEHDSIGIAYTTGRENENLGPPRGVIASEVRNWTVGGRHWFARDWALSYDLIAHEQGILYRREGFRLGIRHRF